MTRFRLITLVQYCAALIVSIVVFQIPCFAQSPTLTVTNCTDSGVSGDGSLRGEIAAAASGTTINFSVDCPSGSPITLTSGTLTLAKNLTISSSGHTVVVDGGCTGCDPGGTPSGGVTVFTVGATVALDGLTIQHGNAGSGYGGGIYNINGGKLTLTNVIIQSSVAGGFGGGILSFDTVNGTNVTISNNRSIRGGGGGIAAAFGTFTLADSTVSGNTTSSTGGGIYNQNNSLTLTNVTISGNTTLNPDGGGGIRDEVGGTATLTNVTVSGNTAPATPGTGGGISVVNSATQNAVLNATRTIVAGNINGDLSGNGINGTNVDNLVSTTLNPINPLLAPLGAYGGPTATRPPLPGSPAIDAGGAGCTGNDQRGLARPVNGACDIGAVESQGFSLTPVTGSTPQYTAVGTAFANPLALTVVPNNAGDPVNGGVVAFAATPTSGAYATLAAPTATIAAGQASVTATANSALGIYTVTASTAGATSVSFTLTNTPGPANTLTPSPATPQSAPVTAAFPTLSVTVKDAGGNLVADGTQVTFTVVAAGNGASATFSNSGNATTTNGVASITATANTIAGGPYTVTATSNGHTATFSLTNTPGAATQLRWTAQPTNTVVGQTITPSPKLSVQDQYGNVETGDSNSSVALTINDPIGCTGGFTAGSTTAANASNGIATFANLAVNTPCGGYTVTASSSGLTGVTSSVFNITAIPTTTALNSVSPTTVQYSDQVTLKATVTPLPPSTSGTITFNAGSVMLASGVSLADAAAGKTIAITDPVLTPASYQITAAFVSTDRNYSSSTSTGVTLTLNSEDALSIQYTGDTAVSTTTTTGSVNLRATINQASDGSLASFNVLNGCSGSTCTASRVVVDFLLNGVTPPACTAAVQNSTTTAGVGVAACAVSVQQGGYTVLARIRQTALYFAAGPDDQSSMSVYPPTGLTTNGGGWIADTGSQNGKSNFGFTIKWTKSFSNLQGNAVLVFRSASPAYASASNPAGLVDVQVKTSNLVGVGLVQSTDPYTVQVTAKANVQVNDAVTGKAIGGFGSSSITNFFLVVTDGTPLGNPDKYYLKILNPDGTLYHLVGALDSNGKPTQATGGGQITVRTQ